jgi:hypothetical protein
VHLFVVRRDTGDGIYPIVENESRAHELCITLWKTYLMYVEYDRRLDRAILTIIDSPITTYRSFQFHLLPIPFLFLKD